jgi:hypothetical protein
MGSTFKRFTATALISCTTVFLETQLAYSKSFSYRYSESKKAVQIADSSICYMQNSRGEVIDLSSLCGSDSAQNNNVSTSEDTSPADNGSDTFSTPQTSESSETNFESPSSAINRMSEQIDNQLFGGSNTGYNTSGECVNSNDAAQYGWRGCGGSAASDRTNSY